MVGVSGVAGITHPKPMHNPIKTAKGWCILTSLLLTIYIIFSPHNPGTPRLYLVIPDNNNNNNIVEYYIGEKGGMGGVNIYITNNKGLKGWAK